MIRFSCLFFCFMSFYFFSCLCPGVQISKEQRNKVLNLINKTYKGTILLSDSRQHFEFLLKLRHEPLKDYRVSTFSQLIKPALAAGCTEPHFGIKGSFIQQKKPPSTQEVFGGYTYLGEGQAISSLYVSTQSQSEDRFYINFREYRFSGGAYEKLLQKKGGKIIGKIIKFSTVE